MDISVIIPVYNAENYIKSCLESVLSQTEVELEVFCIDDASADNSRDIISEYIKSDKRVKYILLEENRGQAYARNVGLIEAQGEYVYFLDSDDSLIVNDALSRLYKKAKDDNVEGVVFDSEYVYEEESLKAQTNGQEFITDSANEGLFKDNGYFTRVFLSRGYSVAVWRQFWKREFLIQNELKFVEETSPHEDLLFSFQAFFLAKTIYYYKKPLHRYCYRKGSTSYGDINLKRFRAYQRIYIESIRFLNGNNEQDLTYAVCKKIKDYLDCVCGFVHDNYARIIKEGIEFQREKPGYSIDDFFAEQIILKRFPMLERTFSVEEYKKLIECKHILVYGAGKYAYDIKKMLDDFDIKEYKTVVTKKADLDDVTEIKDYSSFGENAVVILAASNMYKNEMKDYAQSLGFKNFVDLANDIK